MSQRNQKNNKKNSRRTNKEINIDCENYDNGDAVQVNNGTSNLNASVSRSQSANGGIPHSNSQHTLFESTPDSFRVVKSYREYAAEEISDGDSDTTGGPGVTNGDNTSFGSEYLKEK